MTEYFDVLIAGGGHGGAQTTIALRQAGFEGSIAIVGAERDLPYERPPLSKDYLSGTKSFERLLIRPANFWIERNVRTLMGRQVTAVFPEARRVELAASAGLGYGKLIREPAGGPPRLACEGQAIGSDERGGGR